MLKSDLHPPHTGPGADPVLYGVAAALTELFPLVPSHDPDLTDAGLRDDADRESRDRD